MKSKSDFISKISDQELLKEIALSDEEYKIRLLALEKLTDEEVIFKVAKKDPNWKVRKKAVELLENESMLCQILEKENDYDVVQTAVNKITDGSKLIDVALNAKEFAARQKAVEKITDEHVLANIVSIYLLNKKDRNTCITALNKIKDSKILDNISLQNIDDEMFGIIAKKTCNPQIQDEYIIRNMGIYEAHTVFSIESIKQLAIKNKNPEVRVHAVKIINDATTLEKIFYNDRDYEVRVAAIEKLAFAEKYNINRLCEKAVMEDKSFVVRKTALNFVKSVDLITSVALNDENPEVRKEAIERIADNEVLKEIVLRDYEVLENRIISLKRIFDDDVIKEIKEKCTNWYIKMLLIEGEV